MARSHSRESRIVSIKLFQKEVKKRGGKDKKLRKGTTAYRKLAGHDKPHAFFDGLGVWVPGIH